MDELDDGGELVMVRAAIAERICDKQQQGRAKPFASRCDDVFGDLPNEHHFGMKALADHAINGSHVGGDRRVEFLSRQGAAVRDKRRNARKRKRARQGARMAPEGKKRLKTLTYVAQKVKVTGFST